MTIREKMFREVQLWRLSSKKKIDFVKGKDYTLSKFNYWVIKHSNANDTSATPKFREIPLGNEAPTQKREKTLDINLPSGIKITVYK